MPVDILELLGTNSQKVPWTITQVSAQFHYFVQNRVHESSS